MKQKIIIPLLAVVVVVVIAVVLIGQQQSEQSTQNSTQALKQLKVGLVVWPGFGPYYVAEEKGFYEQYGVDVDLITVEVTNARSALQAGEVDVISLTPETVQTFANAGVDVRVINATDMSSGADGIVATSDVQSIADLKGKTIAVEVGSPSHFLLLTLLKEAGLNSSDVTLQDTAVPEAGAAFAAGKVDVAVTWEPWLSQASQREGGHALASTVDYPILPALVMVKSNTLQNKSTELNGLMRGFYDGLEFIEENPNEAHAIMADQFEVSVDEFKEIELGLTWFDYNDALDYLGTKNNPGTAYAAIDSVGRLWVEEGFISKAVNARDVIDTSLLQNLYK